MSYAYPAILAVAQNPAHLADLASSDPPLKAPYMRMFSALRLSVVCVLTLLQLLVPLVHAHTSASDTAYGLHVPGLEHYRNTATANSYSIALPGVSAEGLMVVVDSGIKPAGTLLKSAAGQPDMLLPAPLYWPATTALSAYSPFIPPLANATLMRAYTPRAPPLVTAPLPRISA